MTTKENIAINRLVKDDVRKLLSIVMTGRDDDYMLDFKYRITTTINHIARNLQRLGRLDEVEILVVDWGSEVPLAQSLPLSEDAAQVCQFVYVPSAIIKAVQSGKDSFHTSKSNNTGIRRAKAEFVMTSAADTLIPQYSLEAILRLLNGDLDLPIRVDQTYFLCNRVHAPWQFVESQPNLDQWERYLLLRSSWHAEAASQNLFIGAGLAGLIMHINMWSRSRGLSEQIGAWGGNDFELMNRIAQYYQWLELSSIGVTFVHMEHGPGGRRGDIESVMEKLEVRLNISDGISVNNEDWGLANYDLDLQTSVRLVSEVETHHGTRDVICNAPSDRLAEDITQGIKADDVRRYVEKILILAAMKSSKIAPEEVAALNFASWYSLGYSPLRYLEFAAGVSFTTAAVALASRSVEIYSVQRFVGPVLGFDGPFATFYQLGWTGHEGYARYINGDPVTAIKRLSDSFIGEPSFDLMMVRGDVFEKDPVNRVEELLPHLEQGGALVYTRSSAGDFRDDWANIQKAFPHFTFVQSTGASTGMILAGNLKDRASTPADYPPMNIMVDLCPLRVNLRRLMYKRIFSLLAAPRKYSHYLKQLRDAIQLSEIHHIIFRKFL